MPAVGRTKPCHGSRPSGCASKRGFLVLLRAKQRPRALCEGGYLQTPASRCASGEDNGWLVRFYYYEKRISVEVFHAVSDGGGALVFFKTLLAVYLRELGYSIPNTHGILDVAEEPRRAEREDAYGRYATVRPRREKRGKKAYQNNGTAEPFYTFNVTMGFCSVARLKEKARGYGVSITEYLTAVLLKVIADKQHRERPRRERPVALAIPINLRGWFPSETLRNFILTVRPSIDPSLGEYTFEEVLSQVHHYLRLNINRQQMQAAIAGNVKFTTNRLLQYSNPDCVLVPGHVPGLQAGGGTALLGHLYQPRPLPRAGGDGSTHTPYGGDSGPGHHAPAPLCLRSLWGYHGDHLRGYPKGERYRAGFFPLSGG